MSQRGRPRRAKVGFILGVLGGLLTLSSSMLAGGLLFAGAIGGSPSLLFLGVLSFILPPVVTIVSIVGSILMLARRYRVGAIMILLCSMTVLAMFLLFIIGGLMVARGHLDFGGMAALTFFYMGPFILLLIGSICGLTSR